ncbi:hypothetical protein AURDEDRAFT_158050 [Auricularia subglabra TFB-10046 SS5]|nr:hypothetical protein AURDEDRAFT_158050 [Auricularia subglabra TFB-10046 SS5]
MPAPSNTSLIALYGGNALWFTSAFAHFVFLSERTLARTTSKSYKAAAPGRNFLAEDVLKYLGAFNTSTLVLAVLRLVRLWSLRKQVLTEADANTERQLNILALGVLGVANLSQCIGNLYHARRTGRWIMGHGFDRITVLDTVFSILDFAAVYKLVTA